VFPQLSRKQKRVLDEGMKEPKEPSISELAAKCGIKPKEMAQEEFGSENFSTAWKILKNCEECRIAYRLRKKK